eukprot:1161928-Pelagomonas_calceolata.AAC.9
MSMQAKTCYVSQCTLAQIKMQIPGDRKGRAISYSMAMHEQTRVSKEVPSSDDTWLICSCVHHVLPRHQHYSLGRKGRGNITIPAYEASLAEAYYASLVKRDACKRGLTKIPAALPMHLKLMGLAQNAPLAK